MQEKEKVYYRVNNVLTRQDFIVSAIFVKSQNKGKLLFSPNSLIGIAVYIALLIANGMMTYFYFAQDANIYKIPVITLSVVLILILVLSIATNTSSFANYNYKSMVKVQGEDTIHIEIVFTNKRIYSKDKVNETSYEYNQVINVFDKGDRYYLQLYNNTYLIIKKDCIVFGDKNRLPEFIEKIKDRINTPNI